MRWLTNFHHLSFKWTATTGVGIHPAKTWLSQLVNFKNAIRHSKELYAIKFYFNLEKMPQKHMECFRLLFGHLVWIEHPFLCGIRYSRKAGSLWGMIKSVGGVRKSEHQSWLAKGLGLVLLSRAFNGVQEEIPWEETGILQIESVAFPPGQCTIPQLHSCHWLFDQDGHQLSSTASLSSRPCSLWLLLIP